MNAEYEQLIKAVIGTDENVKYKPLQGGDINHVYGVQQGRDRSVIKINRANKFPEMFKKEAEGLHELGRVGKLKTPKVQEVGVYGGYQYLVLEYVKESSPSGMFWNQFGLGLAAQHQTSAEKFGWKTDNYIGALHQSNAQHDSWTEFLIEERFKPQLKLALNEGIISQSECKKVEAIYSKCEELWPAEPPALLHGDLWSGNYLTGIFDDPYLIDPAVYYGHREMDLGMMHLFGGFDPQLFDSYDRKFPLEKGWKDRIKYNQLYPLLVHLNLFGRGYFGQINAIVSRFS